MMDYTHGKGEYKNWMVCESGFNPNFQGKCEATFALGNGYMGLRSSTEETYVGQIRNTFVAGTFNKCDNDEVTELPNVADVIGMDIYINEELFSLEKGSFTDYKRTINLKTGEIERSFNWMNKANKKFQFLFKRIVSLKNLHTIATKVEITPVDCSADIKIISGINGQVSNSGAQHFREGEKRVIDNKFVQMLQETNESGIVFILNTAHNIDIQGNSSELKTAFEIERRKVYMMYSLRAVSNKTITLEKISNIYTSRDKDVSEKSVDEIRNFSIEQLKNNLKSGYQKLHDESANEWSAYWDKTDIKIDGENNFDQLAIRFAQYHLLGMTPKHDNRYGIAGKGLSGEGYKGHSFWDTEIFILPFYTYTLPEISRSLLEYRFKTLPGAHKKAIENGCKGAMYPWESAWMDDGEVTPVWGPVDIITGEATKIWSGFIELHISSDVAFAVWQYYMVTGDDDFMDNYGYEILLDTGIFWASRLEWDEEKGEYHINDVVGPDEYKEHVNNDAFTNYMASWCIENAINYYGYLKEDKKEVFNRLNEKLKLDDEIEELKAKIDKIYLPKPNQDLVIPQDDTYLSKEIIDLTKYKNQKHVGSIFKDINLERINQVQVTKQASVVMLMYLLEHKFDHKIKLANYNYYEPKTLHDSSLSLATHAVLAADTGDLNLAYQMFQKAIRIDLGENMKSSDYGIHAASFGGIWQMVVCGFGGMRMIDGRLRINPKLPREINTITYPINWHGNALTVTVGKDVLKVENKGENPVDFTVFDKEYKVAKTVEINI